MRHSLDGKRKQLEGADLERGIIEHVEILSAKCILLARQGRKPCAYLPNIRREHRNWWRRCKETIEIHQQAGVVPESVSGIEFIGSYGKLICVDSITRVPIVRTICEHPPGVLIDLLPLERLASAVPGRKVLHMASVLSHQIRSGRPNGQHQQFLHRWFGIG